MLLVLQGEHAARGARAAVRDDVQHVPRPGRQLLLEGAPVPGLDPDHLDQAPLAQLAEGVVEPASFLGGVQRRAGRWVPRPCRGCAADRSADSGVAGWAAST